jgi:PAS domain S-box-containing protein
MAGRRRNGRALGVRRLSARVAELEEVLAAIRGGTVDAVVGDGPLGERIYTLASADQPYRIFVESMHEGAVTVSADGDILFCNRRFAEMVRLPLQRVIGAPLRSFIHPAGLALFEGLLERGIGREQGGLLADGGATLPVSMAISQSTIEDLPVSCLVVTDLTEQHAEEERARRLIREMAARAEAEQENKAKDEFLAVLSHELRTPLTAMLGWVRVLKTPAVDDARRTHGLEVIERSVRQQTQLISDLLDVSRIVAGKLSLDRQPVALAALIEAVLDTFRPIAAAKDITVTSTMPAPGGIVRGDAGRLQQIFGNLLANAVKFTPPGGAITVTLETEAGGARVIVRDDGHGIAPAVLPHIFERFRQGDSSSTRAAGGLGIGLTIARHLVEAHDGTITAASEGEGHGATFVVTLPLLPSAPAAEPAPRPAPSSGLAGLRVLLIDDHADTLEVLSAMLAEHQVLVSTADSARAAVDVLLGGGTDVLVCDISMPGEDGLTLIRRMRAAGGALVPAIALSAYARPEDRQRALAAGFDAHLAKPVEPADLVAAITGVMAAR